MKTLFSLWLICSISLGSFAQENFDCYHYDEKGRTREHLVDFQSMLLEISFDTQAKKVFGKVHYEFRTIRPLSKELTLDAPEIVIDKVKLDGDVVAFTLINESLVIALPNPLPWEEEHSLDITYSAQPEKGLYFLGWNDSTNRARKQIWTQGQGVDNRYWIPIFDDVSDKLVTETKITFPSGFEVISNGDLLEQKDNEDGTTIWHYQMNEAHVPYLIMIAIGEYDYVDMVSSSGVKSRQYYYPNRPQEVAATYAYSNEMMDWMEKEFNVNYPWGKIYRNVPVADFLYGAMENTTSTIFTDYYLQDSREALERNYVGTNAHELTHQWFGDLISEWNGASHWLHESFATHYAKHFERSVFGEEYFQWERYMEMRRAMKADDSNDLPIAHSQSGSSRHYPKGSFIIDMLRDAAGGDDAYRKVITSYLNKYAFKHVDTHLFQMEFMEVLGLNLDWFFNQWVLKGGYPVFSCLHHVSEKQVELELTQTHTQNETIGLFKVQMPIHIKYANGTDTLFYANIEDETTKLIVPKPQGLAVEYVLFNVNNAIYGEIKHERTTLELLAQAQDATHMIDRYLALRELEEVPVDEKRDVLFQQFEEESFYAPKANIVKQLANDNHKKSKALIINAMLDKDLDVRRAVVYHLDEISKKVQPKFEALLLDSSYITIEKALEKLAEEFPENTNRYLEITQADANRNDLFNIAHLALKVKGNDTEALRQLIDYAGPSFEFRIRIKAIETLTKLAYQGEDFVPPLVDAAVSFNRRLAGVGRNALVSIENQDFILDFIEIGNFDKNQLKRIEQLKEKLTN